RRGAARWEAGLLAGQGGAGRQPQLHSEGVEPVLLRHPLPSYDPMFPLAPRPPRSRAEAGGGVGERASPGGRPLMSRPFRILSLDGGGIMGAFAASALATLERATGRRAIEHFDLITGTSTGGIIAVALGMGASSEDVCRFYEQEGAAIFPERAGL